MEPEEKKAIEINGKQYQIIYVPLVELRHPTDYQNPRKRTDQQFAHLEKSIQEFGMPQPLIVNSAEGRKGIIIGGNFRFDVLKELSYIEAPVIYLDIPDIEREKELNLRLNKNTGEFDEELLAQYFTEEALSEYGWESEELDDIFEQDESPEEFDLKKELEIIGINDITVQKGDIWQLGDHRILCGDSIVEEDVLRLMHGEKADMCLTDPPYILDYLNGKHKHGNPTEGFGYKRDRKYLETDVLPPNFTEKWMANTAKIQKDHFSIIVYENWKNIRIIWGEMENHWKVKNMIVWHIPNRHQGFAAKYKFFSKHDIAMVGANPDMDIEYNNEPEEDALQEEYESALYAISGKPQWESYENGKKFQPTDFIEHIASDRKNSGQGVIFGTKPIEILIPYIKVLTKREDIIYEPFLGSGSTLIAAEKMKRRCYGIEKVPTYCMVVINRWERLTGKKAIRVNE